MAVSAYIVIMLRLHSNASLEWSLGSTAQSTALVYTLELSSDPGRESFGTDDARGGYSSSSVPFPGVRSLSAIYRQDKIQGFSRYALMSNDIFKCLRSWRYPLKLNTK